jgi:hypothetical protein
LPKPPGWNATATGLAFLGGDPNRPVVVGNLSDAADRQRPALWLRNLSGQFTNTVFDDQAAASAIVTRDTPLGLIIVVCGKFRLSNGDYHACVWEISGQSIQRTDLGALTGGSDSEAVAAWTFTGLTPGTYIVGNSTAVSSGGYAMLWGNTGSGWFYHTLPTPAGAQSRAKGITHTYDGDLYIVGDVTEPNGRTTANVWLDLGFPTALSIGNEFGDLLRRRNSTANGIIIGGSGADLLAVGSAWNTESDRTGLGVLANGRNSQLLLIFAFDSLRRTETVDNNETITFHSANAIAPDGAIAGEGLCSGSTTARAMLLLPIKE